MAKRKKKGSYQTGRSSRAHDKRVKAKSPGKRRSSGGSVYYERRKNRSDKPGSLLGVKLKKFPKKPKASASTKTLENYKKRAAKIKTENSKRTKLARSIGQILNS